MELFETSLFTGLDILDRSFLNEHFKVESFVRDTTLFSRGEQADTLFVLKSGLLKMTQSRHGTIKEEIVCLIEPGDDFCLSPLLQAAKHHMSAVAIENCEVFLIKRADILELIDRSHEFSRRVIQILAKKECQLCEDVCDLSLSTTKERLAKFLLDQAKKNPTDEGFRLALNQSDLAGYLGTVRESVSRDMAAFKRARLIEVGQGTVRILDQAGLKKMADRS